MALNEEKLARFVAKTKRRKELEEELSTIKEELEGLESTLRQQFAQGGVQRITVDGMTVYLHRAVRAKYADKAAAVQALLDSGHDDYVKPDFNFNSVSSLISDLTGAKDKGRIALDLDGLPPEWAGRLEPAEHYSVRAVKA